jgi:MFS transporter, OFA family, oxalate/formate antiporter
VQISTEQSCKFNRKFTNVHRVIGTGGIITTVSLFLASYLTHPIPFIYSYSICFGIGKGLMYSSALSAAISHLPSRKGTISGIVVCGFGFGGFLFGIIANR